MENLGKSLLAQLEPEAIKELAHSRKITEEEVVFSLMKCSPSFYGSLSDWDDIRPISIHAINELKPFMSWKEIYVFVLRIITLYDTQIICVMRTYSDVKRLAYFINEMIESLLEVPAYKENLIAPFGLNDSDWLAIRGLVLKRITSMEVRKKLLEDKGQWFKAELYRAANASVVVNKDRVRSVEMATL